MSITDTVLEQPQEAETAEEISEWLASMGYSPLEFVQTAFPWGQN